MKQKIFQGPDGENTENEETAVKMLDDEWVNLDERMTSSEIQEKILIINIEFVIYRIWLFIYMKLKLL